MSDVVTSWDFTLEKYDVVWNMMSQIFVYLTGCEGMLQRI